MHKFKNALATVIALIFILNIILPDFNFIGDKDDSIICNDPYCMLHVHADNGIGGCNKTHKYQSTIDKYPKFEIDWARQSNQQYKDKERCDKYGYTEEIKKMLNEYPRKPGIAVVPIWNRQGSSGRLEANLCFNNDKSLAVDQGKQYSNMFSEEDLKTMELFASKYFTSDMTVADKLFTVHQWIHQNVQYAAPSQGGPELTVVGTGGDVTYIDAIFNHRLGQCIGYNAAMAIWLCYFGYPAYVVCGYSGGGGQHYWCECEINGTVYYVETGNEKKNKDTWQYFFVPQSSKTGVTQPKGNDTGNKNDGGKYQVNESITGPGTGVTNPGNTSSSDSNTENLNSSTLSASNQGFKIDTNWVNTKDMGRHGGVALTPEEIAALFANAANQNAADASNSSDNASTTTYTPGMAEGEYAISVEGGSYYWYHQATTCSCKYCGDWSQKQWGSSGDHGSKLGSDGCAIYSMSIIVSNLTNKAITPSDYLSSLGVNVGSYFNTDGSKFLNGRCITGGDNIMNGVASDIYKLEHTSNLSSLSSSEAQSKVDEVLNKHGMIWFRYNSKGMKCPSGSWPTQNLESHFSVIRAKASDGKYLLLDEIYSTNERRDIHVEWDTLYKAISQASNKYLYGVWNPNTITVASSSFNTDGKWFSSASGAGLTVDSSGQEIGSGVKIYSGLPWQADGGTVVADCNTMTRDLYSWCVSLGGEEPKANGGKKYDVEAVINKKRWLNDTSVNCNLHCSSFTSTGGGQVAKIDGVTVVGVCPPPCVVDPTYNVAFNTTDSDKNKWLFKATPEASAYQYGKKKMAAILKNDSGIKYLPCTPCDAKGHTFPGGLAQTNIKLVGKATVSSDGKIEKFGSFQRALNNSGYSYDTKNNVTPSQLVGIMNDQVYSSSNYTAFSCMDNIAEFWHMPTAVKTYLTNNGYHCIGYVVWA